VCGFGVVVCLLWICFARFYNFYFYNVVDSNLLTRNGIRCILYHLILICYIPVLNSCISHAQNMILTLIFCNQTLIKVGIETNYIHKTKWYQVQGRKTKGKIERPRRRQIGWRPKELGRATYGVSG